MDTLLKLDRISCSYNGRTVVDSLSLEINSGMLCCLLGPSGCGKTTVLRAIAGFEPLRAGEIRLNGEVISSPTRTLAPEKRGLGMMFQDHALFPHLNVNDNIVFGIQDQPRSAQQQEAGRLLELAGLSGYGERYPHELSGGQQQRVALARALAPRPKLLLLDEPFSNLDADLRTRLAINIRDSIKEQGTAALFVTHDQHEAFMMGERVGVMNDGHIAQWDTPLNLYHHPVNKFVGDFIGEGRFLSGRMVTQDSVDTPLGIITGKPNRLQTPGDQVDVLLRPEHLVIGGANGMDCEIVERAFCGAETLYTLRLNDSIEVLSLMPSDKDFTVGQTVKAAVNSDHLVLFLTADTD